MVDKTGNTHRGKKNKLQSPVCWMCVRTIKFDFKTFHEQKMPTPFQKPWSSSAESERERWMSKLSKRWIRYNSISFYCCSLSHCLLPVLSSVPADPAQKWNRRLPRTLLHWWLWPWSWTAGFGQLRQQLVSDETPGKIWRIYNIKIQSILRAVYCTLTEAFTLSTRWTQTMHGMQNSEAHLSALFECLTCL